MKSATHLFFGITAIALAQEPIRITTRLVQTGVIVRDEHGPIGDLTAQSFKIFEDGREQRISIFRVSTPAAAVRTSAAPPPGVFTNRLPGVRAGKHIVLLIDTLNTEVDDQASVRTQLLEMFGKIEIRDPIAIHVLGEKFRVLHDFSTDRESLRKAVEGFKPERSMLLFGSSTTLPGEIRRQAGASQPVESPQLRAAVWKSSMETRVFYVRRRTRMTLDVFGELVKQLRRFPGPKSVVWISDAFPAGFLHMWPDALRQLNLEDVAFYPVHARGLVVSIGDAKTGRGEIATLQEVAEQTGGRAFYNSNDLSGAIHTAIEDGQVTYTIGYYSPREKPDGNFHALKLKVERSGAEVRHRAGYFDVETKPASETRDESRISLVAAAVRAGGSFQVAVQVDFNDLVLEYRDGRWLGSAELAFISQSADGATLDVVGKKLTFDMKEEAYRARQRAGFALEQTIPARAGAVRIRVAVVDSSGAEGAVVVIPNAE